MSTEPFTNTPAFATNVASDGTAQALLAPLEKLRRTPTDPRKLRASMNRLAREHYAPLLVHAVRSKHLAVLDVLDQFALLNGAGRVIKHPTNPSDLAYVPGNTEQPLVEFLEATFDATMSGLAAKSGRPTFDPSYA